MMPCPCCRCAAPLHFRTKDWNRRLSREAFEYYRCPECALIFLSPIPANLAQHYPTNYYSVPSSLAQLASAAARERYKIEIVTRFISQGRLLEIGPSYGSFAYLAKDAGFEVETIEMDPECCRFLTEIVGVKAINSDDVPSALRTTKPFDVIALWHVIEHLPDPWPTLEDIAASLLPNGIVVIATPNPAAFQFRALGSRWTHIDAPRHLEIIPLPLLVQQMQGLGLEPVLATSNDEGGLGWNGFGWKMSLRNTINIPGIRFAIGSTGKILEMLARPLERRALQGSAYTAVFRKAG